MKALLAGLAASLAALFLNRGVVRPLGRGGAIALAPWEEEGLKTGLALLLGAPVVPVHFVFGLVEATCDLFSSEKRGWAAGLLGLGGHVLFGLVTEWAWTLSGHPGVGAVAAGFLHMLWNWLVL